MLLDQAIERLQQELVAAGKAAHFDELSPFLTSAGNADTYAAAAAQLAMTPGAVATSVHRLRQRYRDLLCEEVANTVANASEVEGEIRWLFTAVG